MTATNVSEPRVAPSGAQAAIERLLRERIGLNAASIGSACVLRAIQQRMTVTGIRDISSYHQKLLDSEREFTELVEMVTVPETWFFRTYQAFTALEAIAKHEWLPAHPNDVLHILCVPCSTGEEPYSIAMSLLNTGFQPAQFIIDAVDINTRNLAHAKRAIYTRNSFRNQDLTFRDKFFTKSGSAYQLIDRVKQTVNFIQGNLIDPAFMPGDCHYDIIFCRNLLIYFDRPTQEFAVGALDRLLAPKGVLFLGHAEGALALSLLYSSARYPMAFAFQRGSDERRQHGQRAPDDIEPLPRVERRAHHERRKAPAPAPARPFADFAAPEAPAAKAITPDNGLDDAFRCANDGHLVEAATLCERYLQDNGPCAQAYYLLGLVRDAAGNKAQADEYLRKALYLDPNHYEALIHLAVLAEQQADHQVAQQLRQRAQRVRDRLKTADQGAP